MSAACLTLFLARVTGFQLDAVDQSEVEEPNWVNGSVPLCGRHAERCVSLVFDLQKVECAVSSVLYFKHECGFRL